jgi:hypothetical protein
MPTHANRKRSAEVQATSAPILLINTATGLTGDVVPDPFSPMHPLIELQALPFPAMVSLTHLQWRCRFASRITLWPDNLLKLPLLHASVSV